MGNIKGRNVKRGSGWVKKAVRRAARNILEKIMSCLRKLWPPRNIGFKEMDESNRLSLQKKPFRSIGLPRNPQITKWRAIYAPSVLTPGLFDVRWTNLTLRDQERKQAVNQGPHTPGYRKVVPRQGSMDIVHVS
jgi:hypothetical protein